MKFVLKIELGNDAMQTPNDVADALRKLATRLQDCIWSGDPTALERIRDANGATVGSWTVE